MKIPANSLNRKLAEQTPSINIEISSYTKENVINALNQYNLQIPCGMHMINFFASDGNYYAGAIVQKINNNYGFGITITYYNALLSIRLDNTTWRYN